MNEETKPIADEANIADERNNPALMALTALVVHLHMEGIANMGGYIEKIDLLASSAEKSGFAQSAAQLVGHRERLLRRLAVPTNRH